MALWFRVRVSRRGRASLPDKELYDLTEDPGETRNLAWEQPTITKRMERLLNRWISDTLADAGRSLDPMVIQRGGEDTVFRIPLW